MQKARDDTTCPFNNGLDNDDFEAIRQIPMQNWSQSDYET